MSDDGGPVFRPFSVDPRSFRPIAPGEERDCFDLLSDASMFRHMNPENIMKIVQQMESVEVRHGQILLQQGEPTKRAYLLSKGVCSRHRVEDGQTHIIDESGRQVFASLHLINEDPTFSTVVCKSDTCSLYSITSSKFNDVLNKNPEVSREVIVSLAREVRRNITVKRTPLFEQHPKALKSPLLVYSIAAGVESFFRSALNTILNAHLAGQRITGFSSLFPNMHQQFIIRIMYINGFKGIRSYLDNHVDPETIDPRISPAFGSFLIAITPGVCMTPISSLLEAANVTQNTEPLWRRWTRGLVPRGCREIIFGIGLNQLSDWFEERLPFIANDQLRNAAGSLMAGVASGYCSHVVHNLCTLKLMFPNQSYGQHFETLAGKWLPAVTDFGIAPERRLQVSQILAVFAPRGLMIRTSQIVGSFIILNGVIAALSHKNL